VGEVIGSQNYAGLLMLLVLNLVFFRPNVKLKQILKLMAVGITSALTGIFYAQSLQTLPAAVGVVFLFQFVWIGIVIESVAHRKWPSYDKVIAIPFLLGGTLMAGGIFELGKIGIALNGTIWGLLSSITFALFIFLSGRVDIDVPAINRSLFIIVGSVITISLIYPPKFFINGALSDGLPIYGILLGILGTVIPPLFFAIGVPHIGSGLASILSSSELPVAVLVAAILLGEQISPLRWLGIAITLVGISLPYLLLYINGIKYRRSVKRKY
ncbi:MAG TPA: DMT family transporter, partial [Desulfosporosinus sp.]|nr:DMT family transporter [Desulfosporosinus sp.]